jgi:hypothetical protein
VLNFSAFSISIDARFWRPWSSKKAFILVLILLHCERETCATRPLSFCARGIDPWTQQCCSKRK